MNVDRFIDQTLTLTLDVFKLKERSVTEKQGGL